MCIQELLKQEQHLKDSKKNSSAQIMELSAQLKSIYEEVNTESNPPPLPMPYLRESVCMYVCCSWRRRRGCAVSLWNKSGG